MNDLAQVYAKAYWQAGGREAELEQLAGEVKGAPALAQALESPAISSREKRAVIGRLFSPKELQTAPVRLLLVLCTRDRTALLGEILEQVHLLALANRGWGHAQLSCAHQPDEKRLKRIEEFACRQGGYDHVEMTIRLDEALLGGFVLEEDGVTYDASVRGSLSRLARRLDEVKI